MRMFKTSIPIVRAAAAMLRTAYPGLMRTIPRDTKNADFRFEKSELGRVSVNQ